MNASAFLFTALSSIAAAAASIILRLDGMGVAKLAVPYGPYVVKFSALAIYGLGFLFFSLALKTTEVRLVYPLMVAMTVVQIVIFSALFERPPHMISLIGIAVILVGIFLALR